MIVTTIIQILLLLAIIGLMAFFVSNRRKARAKAGVKIGFVLFVVGCVWAVLRPDDLTVVANWLGVDRGTDLLLYLLTLAFLFVTVSTYIRFREQELRYARLARAVALMNAVPPEVTVPPEGSTPTDGTEGAEASVSAGSAGLPGPLAQPAASTDTLNDGDPSAHG